MTAYAFISINIDEAKEVVGIYVIKAESSKILADGTNRYQRKRCIEDTYFCTDNLNGLGMSITA